MRLAEPLWLILILLAPLPCAFARARPRANWPTLGGFPTRPRLGASILGFIPVLIRGTAIALLAVAIARPQSVAGRTRIAGQGVAIVVVLDQSSSMNTEDFPNGQASISRLRAAKETLSRFINGRPDDLIGLVVFANYSDLAAPTTLDHAFLQDVVGSIRTAEPGDDGTNLGDAMVVGLKAIEDASPKKRVLILLTDGRNAPAVPDPADPLIMAGIAHTLGVTVHTIAVGKREVDAKKAEEGPDFTLLAKIAEAGGGRGFEAADAGSLERVFTTINTLEKSAVRGEVRTRYREDYGLWAAAALTLFAFDRLLVTGRLRRLP